MVYQLDSYRYRERYLNRSDFVHGQFGENLTVDGLADADVCIGDRFRIGDGIFEVTQPRVTCYRLGIRMNHPEMPALVVSHRRPGFYLRVLKEGTIFPTRAPSNASEMLLHIRSLADYTTDTHEFSFWKRQALLEPQRASDAIASAWFDSQFNG